MENSMHPSVFVMFLGVAQFISTSNQQTPTSPGAFMRRPNEQKRFCSLTSDS
jgi:hypothetical protein